MITRETQIRISDLCSRLEVDGLRGDLVINRAAKALVAFNGRKTVTIDDVQTVIPMCLGHRLRTDPFDTCTERDKILMSWTRVLELFFHQ
jgi:magnesium chelatase subunit I